ncbi:Origin recognition complex subunit 5 [Borealophlyctis nickersoniae]|nr:Origin recognition complex subunit 5 [Borealophlyctis nickersoniae]
MKLPELVGYRVRLPPLDSVKSLTATSQTRQNITTIFISSIAWDDFRCRAGSMDPVVVHFPQYTKPDVLKIISRDCPPDEEMPFFLSFVDLVYGVFYKPCRDLNELRHLVALLFPKYVEPVLAGKGTLAKVISPVQCLASVRKEGIEKMNGDTVTRQQTAKLFQHIQHHMKEALHSLYLREISSSEWLKKSEAKSKFLDVSRKWTQEVDLPYYTKFLLIASFLASYNPPRLDVRFFSRGGEERKKRKGGRGKVPKSEGGGKMRQQLLGPKAFPVERMLAIFYSIVETDVDCSVDIQTQITSLISLRLLARVTSVDRLDSVKCKCNVSFEFIEKVGRSVRFNVSKYLHDFM